RIELRRGDQGLAEGAEETVDVQGDPEREGPPLRGPGAPDAELVVDDDGLDAGVDAEPRAEAAPVAPEEHRRDLPDAADRPPALVLPWARWIKKEAGLWVGAGLSLDVAGGGRPLASGRGRQGEEGGEPGPCNDPTASPAGRAHARDLFTPGAGSMRDAQNSGWGIRAVGGARLFLLGPLRPARLGLGSLAADGGCLAGAHDRRAQEQRIGEEQPLDVGIAEERLPKTLVRGAFAVLVEELEDPT